MPIIRRSNCVPLPIVVCPVVAVVMLESWVARCVQCVENVAWLWQDVCSVWRMLPASGKMCALCGECCLTVARWVQCVENVAWLWQDVCSVWRNLPVCGKMCAVCVCVCGCLPVLLFWYVLILFSSTLVTFLHVIFHLSFCYSLCFFLTISLSPSFFSWLPLNTTLVGFVISALGTGSDSTWPASHWLTDASSEFKIRCARSYPVDVRLLH